jgi:NitT/TauT family transport system ATP-binding protein
VSEGDAIGLTPASTEERSEDPAAVVLRHVSFTYPGGVEAVRDVSFALPRKRNVAIIGPSGCGKTTLLSILAGDNRPTSGAASVASFDRNRHKLAMVFQKDTLLPWLTTVDNIKLYHKYNRTNDRKKVDEQVAELIELAGLRGFEKRYPYELSGGMRRRVAFLSAIASTPEVLLLDEPFASVDEPTRIGIHQDVFEIIRRLEISMILITHDLAEAISLCDEVIILTARPGTVFSRHEVPFGDSRSMLELRQLPPFLELYGTLWRELSDQIASRENHDE